MKHKFLAVVFCCLILLSSLAIISPAAESDENAAAKAESFIGGIVAYNQPNSNIQEWINASLADSAGNGAEWYILALSQYGEYDFSLYEQALVKYLQNNREDSAASREKFALCLSAVGSTNGYIAWVTENAIGELGIMSYIYGLHLLNNGYKSAEHTVDSVIAKLLSLQLSDGGFAVNGEYGDNDVTAMTLQALASHYESKPEVKSAVDKALMLLSSRQDEDGDYASYGVYNPESTAQVLVALSSLGIDCESDTRFIKNGNTLFDGIEKYRLPNGSFCHKAGGESNGTATVQVFYAMVSYLRMKEGKSPLYIFDNAVPDEVKEADSLYTEQRGEPPSSGEEQNAGYKPWVILVILSLGAVVAVVLLILKKRNYKNFVALILAVAIAITFVLVTDFRSAEDYYNGQDAPKGNVIGKVTMTIRCDTIVGKSDAEYIPADGVILAVTEFDLAEEESVYDILVEAARKYGIQMESKGGAENTYVKGIGYIYEREFGSLSGWVYHINGVSAEVGCGEYKLSDGDVIEWHYTCDLGKDVE